MMILLTILATSSCFNPFMMMMMMVTMRVMTMIGDDEGDL